MIDPEILEEVRRIQCLTSRMVTDVMAGQYESVFKGRGMEFTEVRQYQIGDDIRTIDWNVTARTGIPFVKEFVEERELTVMLVVDASHSLDTGSNVKPAPPKHGAPAKQEARTKRRFVARLAAVLALTAVRNNDKVGLIIFTDDVELYVPPMKGKRHVLRVIRELLAFTPKGRGTNIKNALEYLVRLQRRKCVTFLISDFLDQGYEQDLTIASRKHDLIAISVNDRLEQEIPPIPALVRVIDPETGDETLIDGRSAHQLAGYRSASAAQRESQVETFRRRGVDLLSLGAQDDDYAQKLLTHFRQREQRR